MPAVRKSRRNAAQKAPGYYYQDQKSDEESLSEIEYDDSEPETELWEIGRKATSICGMFDFYSEYIKGARVNEQGLWVSLNQEY